jgi:hypothetical protein
VRRLLLLGLIGLGIAAGAAVATHASVHRAARFRLSGLGSGPPLFHDTVLSGSRRLQAARRDGEWGGNVTANDGEVLQLFVSDTYPVDATVTQSLADFMVQLYHGDELTKAVVYVAPLDEVQSICGLDAGGCYDPSDENIVIPGDVLPDGTTKETILVHELGHNVARNRVNSPWDSVDWGTKRWATAENICARAATGTAFPGDESANYALDPGEGFAESYRILNFQKQAWPQWTVLAPIVVDQSFYPTAADLEALKEDVLDPWTAPTVTSWNGRVASPRRAVRHLIQTPLDGSFSAKLVRAPAGASITLVDPRSGKMVAKGTHRVSTVVCGRRSLSLVVRATKPGTFSATYAAP